MRSTERWRRSGETARSLAMRYFYLWLLVVPLIAVGQEERVSAPPGEVFTYKEVDGEKRELDVYFPEGHDPSGDPVPAIIFFHGGGWGGGSREAFSYQCDYFASRGLVAVTVTYTLASKERAAKLEGGLSRKRICMPDAKSAIRWVKQNAGDLGVDPERLIAAGGSAGGHISLIATSNSGLNHPDDPEGFDTSVAARVVFNPALSTGDAADSEIDYIQHLKPGAPPAIVFFGSEDKSWLKGWNPTYEKWKGLEGTTVKLEIAEGEKHAFFNFQPWADLTLISADRFLAELGFLEGEPTLSLPESGERLVPAEE